MALLSLANDVLPFLEKTADDAYANIARTQTAAEQFAATYCNRTLEAATTTEKLRLGDGQEHLLKYRPVTEVLWFRVGRATAMSIANSNTATTATVTVTTTGLTLRYNGIAASADLTFATNTTLTALAAAVNGEGSGWSATVASGMGDYQSSFLIPHPGRSALSSHLVDLYIPSSDVEYYDLNEAQGAITLGSLFFNASGWLSDVPAMVRGSSLAEPPQDMYIRYTGGYTSSTIPSDLKYAILILIQTLYNKVTGSSFGVRECSIAGYSRVLEGFATSNLPMEVGEILNRYRNATI